MTAVSLTRTLAGFAPSDDAAKAVLRKIPAGESIVVDIRRPRNIKNHRRYWALIQLAFQNSEDFKSPDQLHDFVKLMSGHCTQVKSKATGEVFLVADSISFSNMDETAFEAFFDRAKNVILEHVLPGVTDPDLERELLSLTGAAVFR